MYIWVFTVMACEKHFYSNSQTWQQKQITTTTWPKRVGTLKNKIYQS